MWTKVDTSVATGVSCDNIRLLLFSTSDFYSPSINNN